MSRKLKLAGFQIYSNTTHAQAGWRNPATNPDFLSPGVYQHIARTLERGRFDFLFFADALTIHSHFGDGIEDALRTGAQATTGLDPSYLVPVISAVTEHLGIAVTKSTTYFHPFDIARSFATLDHVTAGRTGWNIVTSFSDFEARNFGVDTHLDHDFRYDRSDEFVELATKLWASWEPDALVLDKAGGVFADPAKVKPVHHDGRYFKSRGPLTVPRSPQGRPVLVQAGASARGRDFAARWADVVFEIDSTTEGRKQFYADLKGRAASNGRRPEDLLILPAILPFAGETAEIAREKFELHNSLADPLGGLVNFSGHIGVDLSQFDLDLPIEDLTTNGIEGLLSLAKKISADKKLSLRDLGRLYAQTQLVPPLVGTGSQIADELEDIFRNEQADGFVVSPAYSPGAFDDFVNLVVPELQKRGIFRTGYEGKTLRGNLGLPAV